MTSVLSCDILTSGAQVAAIADEWRQLYARASQGVFADYDWFDIWWRTLGKTSGSQTLHVVTGRIAGKLVAVLPLVVARRKGLRILQAAGHKAFYCCDMVCEEAGQAVELWKVARRSPYYDFADIRDVYSKSVSYGALSSFANRRDVTEAYSLNIQWPASKDWLAFLPGKRRRDFLRYMRRMEEKAPVSYEVCRAEPIPAAIIDNMVREKIAWCKERGKTGLFDHPNVYEYFHQLAKIAARQGRLCLSWVKCGNDVVAYSLGFINKDVLRGYVISYDLGWANYAPGTVILANSILWAIDNGMTAVDIAQGGGYKAKFSNEIGDCVEFTFSGSLRGKLMEYMFITLRKVLRTLRGGNDEAEGDDEVRTKLPKDS